MSREINTKPKILTEGWSQRTTKGKVLACLLEQTRLKKEELGKINLGDGWSEIEWLGDDLDALDRAIKGLKHLLVDERKVFCWSSISGQKYLKLAKGLTEALEKSAKYERDELNEMKEGFRFRRVEVDWDHLERPIWTMEIIKGGLSPDGRLNPWQGLTLKSGEKELDGRLMAIEGHQIQVLLSREDDEETMTQWEIFPSFHELAHRRRLRAVARMPYLMERHNDELITKVGLPEESRHDLNELQNKALKASFISSPLLIHGPPGTGKTHLLGALIAAQVSRGLRVLACTASHSAADHLARKAIEHGVDPLRLGQEERLSDDILPFHLRRQLERDPEVRLAKSLVREARKKLVGEGLSREQKKEAREMLSEGKAILRQRRRDMIERAPLLVSTLAHMDPILYGDLDLDVVVIDEAGQCLEPEAWQGLSMGRRWILAGDPQQLPATVKGPDSTLSQSLLERWMMEDHTCVTLHEQYRMAPILMAFPSKYFYGGDLVAIASSEPSIEEPLLRFVDMAGSGEGEEKKGRSLINLGEVDFILGEVRRWLGEGVPHKEIGVISPYRAQVELLSCRLEETGVEVRTIDGFQGREKEVILISLVRSNLEGQLGFLNDHRRMNVALTRAKRVMVVMGDSSTLSGDSFYAQWLDHVEEEAEYRSCFEWDEE